MHAASLPVFPTPLLHRDALHSVFACLEWRELLHCAHVCKDWQSAAATSRRRHRSALCKTDVECAALLRSPLRAHMSSLDCESSGASGSNSRLLLDIAAALLRLGELHLRISFATLEQLPLAWSVQLRSLALTLEIGEAGLPPEMRKPSPTDSAALLCWLERVMTVLPPSCSSFELSLLHAHDERRLFFPPVGLPLLARVASLTALRLDASWENQLVRQTIRSMLQLRCVHCIAVGPAGDPQCVPWDQRALEQLTAGRSGVDYPQLESIGPLIAIDWKLRPERLLRLPGLTELKPAWLNISDLPPLLAGLPQLRTLTLNLLPYLFGMKDFCIQFRRVLPQCAQLANLRLTCAALIDDLLAVAVHSLPQLQSLTVSEAALTSLRCFAEAPHLAATLQRLALEGTSGSVSPAELLHLCPLRALRFLRVHCLSELPDAAAEAQLTPGDAQFAARFWPKLESVSLRVI